MLAVIVWGLIRGVYSAFWPETEQPPAYSPNWAEANSEETLANAAKRYLLPVDQDVLSPSNILLFRYKRGYPAKHAGMLIDETRFSSCARWCWSGSLFLFLHGG